MARRVRGMAKFAEGGAPPFSSVSMNHAGIFGLGMPPDGALGLG